MVEESWQVSQALLCGNHGLIVRIYVSRHSNVKPVLDSSIAHGHGEWIRFLSNQRYVTLLRIGTKR